MGGRFHYSQKIAQRCFTQAESILCTSVGDDPELAAAQSIADGQMSSVLCVLLRTARRKLGLLHLDRSYWQKPFTEDEINRERESGMFATAYSCDEDDIEALRNAYKQRADIGDCSVLWGVKNPPRKND